MKKLGLVVVLGLILAGCSAISKDDREMAQNILNNGNGCVYIHGSGGGGALPVPPVGIPLSGAYGEGTLAAASGPGAVCGPAGAGIK